MPEARRQRIRTIAGIAISLLIGSLALWVLYRTFQHIRLVDVLERMRATPLDNLLLAAGCAAGAFTVLALYEWAVVRYVKGEVGRAKPIVTALIAFPLGHAIGQAMLSGGAIRYRMYSPAGFSAMEVGATVLMCNLAYGLAVGLLLDVSLVLAADRLAPLFRLSAEWLVVLGCIGLAKDFGYMLLVAFRRAPVRIRGWSFKLPTPAMTALQYVVGVADAVGTAAQPLGNHIATCRHCSNAHRVLKSDGTIAPHFRWSDPGDERDPMELLLAEGALVNGSPDPARELSSDALQVLIEQ